MAHPLDDVTPLTWREAGADDLDDLGHLVAAINYFDEPAQAWDVHDIRDYFSHDQSPLSCLVIGYEADSAVAFGWNTSIGDTLDPVQIRLGGGVHPAFRHQSIGRRTIQWQAQTAREAYVAAHVPGQGDLRLVAYADEKLGGKRGLYRWAGMDERRWFLDLRCTFAESGAVLDELLARPVPDGVRFVPWSDAYSESCREAHNLAFEEVWHAQPVTEAAWREQVHRSAARPEWSWLAIDSDDQVVGYALNSDAAMDPDEAEGWTDRLGVRSSHRGHGIATGLLVRSLDSFRRAGADGGGLGLDTQGAPELDLYRSVGYTATDTIIQYAADEAYADVVAQVEAKHSNAQKGGGR